jgi:hypothetical protein
MDSVRARLAAQSINFLSVHEATMMGASYSVRGRMAAQSMNFLSVQGRRKAALRLPELGRSKAVG